MEGGLLQLFFRRVYPKGLVFVHSLHYAQIDDESLLGVSPVLGVWE